jgi:hypothetical protein
MAPFSCDDADHRHRSYDFGFSWKIDGDASVPTFSCEDVTKERHLPGSLRRPARFSGPSFTAASSGLYHVCLFYGLFLLCNLHHDAVC